MYKCRHEGWINMGERMAKQLTSLLSTLSLSTGSSILLASMKSVYLSAGTNWQVKAKAGDKTHWSKVVVFIFGH